MNAYETKRYEPDFSYESGLPGMFETANGGYVAHGDYATLFSELEVVKADRDALERQLSMSEAKCKGYFSDAAAALVRCDALAVENSALKKSLIAISLAEPIDGETIVCDFDTLVSIAAGALTTPATDAALAAIEARGVENFAEFLDSPIDGRHCYQHEVGLARHFASTLREAK
ncbi:hypothetical protein [Serratia liquefaciens]|uniref:hypothetical protein n=1 Tax=Serratia liquefaciens TaxID=614 RepID=UPI00165D0252|nr:hypothetical protein [Serratia liquefaciens]QNQ52604.1 hypothetical protein IAI46_15250 [Serratia liquefaciens]